MIATVHRIAREDAPAVVRARADRKHADTLARIDGDVTGAPDRGAEQLAAIEADLARLDDRERADLEARARASFPQDVHIPRPMLATAMHRLLEADRTAGHHDEGKAAS